MNFYGEYSVSFLTTIQHTLQNAHYCSDMADKIEEASVEPEIPPSKSKKKPQTETPRESASDLRTLLLILVLAVIVFFMLLYKRSHPEEYAQSLVQVKENADSAYSKAEEVLPVAYRGVGGFFEYVFDYGKAVDLPPELPKVRISPDSVVTEIEAAVSSGSISSGSISPEDAVSLTGGLKSAS